MEWVFFFPFVCRVVFSRIRTPTDTDWEQITYSYPSTVLIVPRPSTTNETARWLSTRITRATRIISLILSVVHRTLNRPSNRNSTSRVMWPATIRLMMTTLPNAAPSGLKFLAKRNVNGLFRTLPDIWRTPRLSSRYNFINSSSNWLQFILNGFKIGSCRQEFWPGSSRIWTSSTRCLGQTFGLQPLRIQNLLL